MPLLACGGSDLLQGPLSVINALDCGDAAQIHGFVEDLAGVLGRKLGSATAFKKCIDELVEENTKCLEMTDSSGAGASSLSASPEEAFKSDFERFIRRLEAEWASEQNSGAGSVDRGKTIMDGASSDLVEFRADIRSEQGSSVTTLLEQALDRVRKLSNFRLSGANFDEFWREGHDIIVLLKLTAVEIEKALLPTKET